jgi:plasmid stabilization system protein ParE
MRVVILQSAEEDILEIEKYYSEVSQIVVKDFFEELKEIIVRLGVFPEIGKVLVLRFAKKVFRAVVLRRFPYILIYELNKRKNNLRIISIVHTHRNIEYLFK